MSTLAAFAIRYPAVVGALLAIAIAFFRWLTVPGDRKRTEWFLVASCLAIPADGVCQAITVQLSRMVPLKLDQYIFRIDGLLGFQPSFALGQLAGRHPWLEILGQIAYGALPCAVLAVWAAYLWSRPQVETLRVLFAFMANLFLAVPIYALVPVCGPAFAFSSFPAQLPAVLAPHRIALYAPANGIPSVHTSTALLILFFAWRWKAGRVLAPVYLALILFATMASGQHYCFDLLTAVPYAAVVWSFMRAPATARSSADEWVRSAA